MADRICSVDHDWLVGQWVEKKRRDWSEGWFVDNVRIGLMWRLALGLRYGLICVGVWNKRTCARFCAVLLTLLLVPLLRLLLGFTPVFASPCPEAFPWPVCAADAEEDNEEDDIRAPADASKSRMRSSSPSMRSNSSRWDTPAVNTTPSLSWRNEPWVWVFSLTW